MKTCREVDVQIYVFLTSGLVGDERSASRPGRFTLGIHWIGGSVGPRAGLEVEKIFDPTRDRILPSSPQTPVAIPTCAILALTGRSLLSFIVSSKETRTLVKHSFFPSRHSLCRWQQPGIDVAHLSTILIQLVLSNNDVVKYQTKFVVLHFCICNHFVPSITATVGLH
jgi:hypothetical protein